MPSPFPWCRSIVTPLALIAAILPLEFLLEISAWLVEWLLRISRMVRSAPRRAVAAARAAAVGRGARHGGRGVAACAARRAVARQRACDDGAGVCARAGLARGGRGLDHRARRRPGPGGGRAYREPHAALRRRAGLRPRSRQRRAHRRAAAARRRHPRRGHARAQPRGPRPPRRRADGAGSARSPSAGVVALARPRLELARRHGGPMRRGQDLGVGRGALRVPAPAAGLGDARAATTRAACCASRPAAPRCC